MKHIKNIKRLIVITLLFFLPLVSADSTVLTMGEAINIAGRQRMLSQRIAQSYLLKGILPQSPRGPRQLDRSLSEFEKNLYDLQTFKPAKPLAKDLSNVIELWQPYKTLATSPVNKANASTLVERSNTLLLATHDYVTKLNQLANTKTAQIIDLSGRQRMLSQRIAKNYLAKYWQVISEEDTQRLYEDLAEYENTLTYLLDSGINTSEISNKLLKIAGQFSYASKTLDGAANLSGDHLIHVITGTTDSMLRNMDEVTAMYAKLLQ